MLLPLALAQFICSFAASNMNVAINTIAKDLHTDVHGVQLAITLFTLIMAAFMIPGSKLTDIIGRKKCFNLGLLIYAVGTVIAALSPALTMLIVGYSIFEGIGTALLIPPVYILVTVGFANLKSRAKAFGIISGMAGIGSAAGPLIGGVITTTISWRAAFLLQTVIVVSIILLRGRIIDAGIQGPKPRFDVLGTILSAFGLIFVVLGILHAGQDNLLWVFLSIGALFLLSFFLYIRHEERIGKEPLLSTSLFKNKISNLGLITQNIQWLTLQGSSFVISVFLQTVKGFSAIATGLMLTPATIGILLSSAAAGRLAQRFSQKTLISSGFIITIAGILLLLLSGNISANVIPFLVGLLFMGTGIGIMLTASVNVVQSSFPEQDQGEISGLSRSVSNLGSSLGTAIVGTVLVGVSRIGNQAFANALITMIIFGCIGLLAALFLPSGSMQKKPV